METIDPSAYEKVLFFTGAGMSAESGVPVYRGKGGVWKEYNFEEYACQEAFDRDPMKVLEFHELRRRSVLDCEPHAGHAVIAELENNHPGLTIVTQNIDGMHQRAGSRKVHELHGSVWRLRCRNHGVREDLGESFARYRCEECGEYLRPDIIWFGDALDAAVIERATGAIGRCDLFISIGTSGVVWPSAGFPQIAKDQGARCIEINPDPSEVSHLYDEVIRENAGVALSKLFEI